MNFVKFLLCLFIISVFGGCQQNSNKVVRDDYKSTAGGADTTKVESIRNNKQYGQPWQSDTMHINGKPYGVYFKFSL